MLTPDWQTLNQLRDRSGQPIGFVLGYLKLAMERGAVECRLPEPGDVSTLWRAKVGKTAEKPTTKG